MFEARVRWVSKQRGTTKISMVATRPMYRGVDLSVRVWIYTPRNIYRRDELNRVKYTKKGMPWRKAYRADMLGIEKGLLDALKSAGVIDDDFPVDHAEFRRQKSQPDDVAPRIIVEVTPYDRCDWIDPPAGTAPVVHADHALDSHGPRVAPTTPTKRRRRSAA
jgi:Holliday junction resolvase RusA-like endonuclease